MNQSRRTTSDNAYTLFKADWIVSVECTYAEDGSREWRYCRKNQKDQTPEDWDWTADWINLIDGSPEADDKKWAGRLTLFRRATKLMDKIPEEPRSGSLARWITDSIGEESLLHWLCKEEGGYLPIQDKGTSIFFDHIVASHSTSSIVHIYSNVGVHRMTEIRGLRPGQPSWFYLPELAETSDRQTSVWQGPLGDYFLSYPEMFLDSKETLYDSKECLDELSDTLHAHRQRTEISVLKYEVGKDSCKLQLRMVATLCRYVRGALCDCLPIPGPPIKRKSGDPEEPVGVYSPEIVISSPVVQSALHSLSDIWQDKAHAILVSSPTGSGKENLALSIPYGSGLKKHDDEERIPTVSLANGLPAQQEKQILGYQQDDGSIVDGMLAKASGAAIFIDEAHYPKRKPGVRASLLRPLEAKEYYPVDSMELMKVDSVQWIFASSLRLDGEDSLSMVPPEDFWTRMTHQIRIEHPLDRDKFLPKRESLLSRIRQGREVIQQQRKTVKNLFRFFWWDRTKSHFGINPVKVLMDKKGTESDDLRTKDAAEQLFRGYIQSLFNEVPLNKMAELFVAALLKEVRSKSLSGVSIRGLRSMVSRVFSKSVGYVTTGSIKNYGLLFKLKKGVKLDTAAEKFVKDDIRKVIREVQQIAHLKS